MKRFLVAHVRTDDYQRLRKEGFLVLHPAVDDYVFLEDTEENRKVVRRENSLGVHFLRRRGVLQTSSEEEINAIKVVTVEKIEAGAEIEVVGGFAANLEGWVKEVKDTTAICLLTGYKREFEVEVDLLDIKIKKPLDTQRAE